MKKVERLHAAVNGEKVDRIPGIMWIHFGTDIVDGAETARLHARYLRYYDWDLAKVVNDYRYPLPEGLETLETPQDMLKFRPQSMEHRTYTEQFRCLKCLRADLGPDWPIIDTLFDPFQQIMRKVGFEKAQMVFDNPKEAKPMLEAATETMLAYVREIKRIGVDGVLYSVNGAICPPHPKGVTEEIFREFMRPYEVRVLEEMKGMVRILHVCQSQLDFSRVLDYPCEVFSWWDRNDTCPSLAELRRRTDKCLMGGVDHTKLIEKTRTAIRAEIHDAISQVGRKKFILAPGCTVMTHAPEHILQCVRDTLNEEALAVAA
ncbi:uroporphyrinogen decarboxylase family protein [Shumkonia mesophila]|uniref:uroporphyrinogen decarboxylase family protein n=1 Tax=Shumkonia mesophila TaxID=2838854 RepID=UPI0029352F36|nr:uroporphyrinogen decarboxylase family protein [Shumkonia mesophila]